MFILGNIFSRQKWSKSRTSFFIDSPLWYVKGDLYQDHDAKAAFVNFSSSNMIFRSAATSWRAGCPRAGPSHNRAAINTVFGVSQSFVKVYYYNIQRPPMDNATCSIIKVPPSLLLGLKMLLPVAAAVKVCTKCSLAKTFFTYYLPKWYPHQNIFWRKRNKIQFRLQITKWNKNCIFLLHKRVYNDKSRWTLTPIKYYKSLTEHLSYTHDDPT